MSKSRKKTPVSTIACCKSQKQDKRVCNRVFRRGSKILLKQEKTCRFVYVKLWISGALLVTASVIGVMIVGFLIN